MRITVLTVCPEVFDSFEESVLVKRARERGLLDLNITDIRNYAGGSFPNAQPRPHIPAPAAAKPAAQPPSFSVGDRITHKAFGKGVITKSTPMGGDYLIEIQFENLGTKKLMLRAAALHMSKDEWD